jgi:hypothetical protein
MNLSDEQLQKVEEYASCFLPWQQIAILLELNESEFKEELINKGSPIYKHYFKGKTVSAFEINKNMVRLAKLGSPQAELLIKDEINKQLNAEMDL